MAVEACQSEAFEDGGELRMELGERDEVGLARRDLRSVDDLLGRCQVVEHEGGRHEGRW
jgi:hypothetical protein